MSDVSMVPNTVLSNTGALTGSSIPAAWTDDDNATYVTYDYGELSSVGFTDPTIPAGVVQRVDLYAKVAKVTGTTYVSSAITAGGRTETNVVTVTTSVPTLMKVGTAYYDNSYEPLTESQLDAMSASVGCLHPTNDARVYEVLAIVRMMEPPTLTVNTPTGTITDHNVVTAGWTPTYDESPSLGIDYEAKVFTDAVYGAGGFDPDTSTAVMEASSVGNGGLPVSHAFSEPLDDDTYRVFIRLSQPYIATGTNFASLTSDWEYSEFTIDVLAPADPDLTLTPDNELARIAVELTANSGDATTDYFEVQRSDDAGETWQFVRTAQEDGYVDNDGGTGGTYDYEAPNGTTCTYRARAIHDYGSGLTAASDWVEAISAWSSLEWWIKHPTLPGESRAVQVISQPGHTRPARQGVFQPIGATYPVVISDTRGPKSGDLVVRSNAYPEQEALDALLDAGIPLLLQGPPEHFLADRWVTFGDHSRTRLVDKGWWEPVEESLPWTEVARPTNSQLPGLFPAVDLLIP